MTEIAADYLGLDAQLAAQGAGLGVPLCVLQETTSTSDEAKTAARAGAPHGATWIAERQTNGRGRQGRAWQSAAGENILLSTLLRTTVPPDRVPPISLVVGLSVRDAVEHATAAEGVRLKWPNDVLIGEKKVAGILIETLVSGARVEAVIVGIGINVLARTFPEDIAVRATSLALVTDRPLRRGDLVTDILRRLATDVDLALHRGLAPFRARLEKADALFGKRVAREDGTSGIARGIDETGGLRVLSDAGVTSVWSSGEVHLGTGLDGKAPAAGR